MEATKKFEQTVARFYDRVESIQNDLDALDGGPYTVKISDVAFVAPYRVVDDEGDEVSRGTILQSSCSDYATEGLLQRGARQAAR